MGTLVDACVLRPLVVLCVYLGRRRGGGCAVVCAVTCGVLWCECVCALRNVCSVLFLCVYWTRPRVHVQNALHVCLQDVRMFRNTRVSLASRHGARFERAHGDVDKHGNVKARLCSGAETEHNGTKRKTQRGDPLHSNGRLRDRGQTT